MIDSLVECPLCKSPYCYQQIHEGVATWKCLSCGFTTNSNMMLNTDLLKAYELTLPKLYIDIRKVDDSNLVWYPLVVDKTQEGKGILFANGTGVDNWGWTFAKSVPVLEEEKERFKRKDGTYVNYKTDMLNAKHFNKNEFAIALNESELF